MYKKEEDKAKENKEEEGSPEIRSRVFTRGVCMFRAKSENYWTIAQPDLIMQCLVDFSRPT